jgi:hypothetical protein
MSPTGPRTPEGKARSAKNALRHGLLSRDVLQADERPRDLQRLHEQLSGELRPVGELESLLVERVVSCVWRLRRALRVEAEIVERSSDSYAPGDEGGAGVSWIRRHATFATLSRYETTNERAMYRALHELERLQAARRGERVPLPAVLDVDVSGTGEG